MISITYSHRYGGVSIKCIDIIKDAFLCGLTKTGMVTYDDLKDVNFSVVPTCNIINNEVVLREITIKSINAKVMSAIMLLKDEDVFNEVYGIKFSLENWKKYLTPLPDFKSSVNCAFIAPFVSSNRNNNNQTRLDVKDFIGSKNIESINENLNYNIQKISGKTVSLKMSPDFIYLKENKNIVINQQFKINKDGHHTYISGVKFPFVLSGDIQDIRLSWFVGLGKKTRYGFGHFDIRG